MLELCLITAWLGAWNNNKIPNNDNKKIDYVSINEMTVYNCLLCEFINLINSRAWSCDQKFFF